MASIGNASVACPKSVRACALRLTRQNPSGVPLDPLVPQSRIQTSAFAQLGVKPDRESPKEAITRSAGSQAIAIIDRECSTLKGLNLDLRLCGIPYSVLEMLTGVEGLVDADDLVVGGALRSGFNTECVNLVQVELWSKNVGRTCDADGNVMRGRYLHWLLPLTMQWEITSDLTFENGPLDVTLSGYAEENPAWYPSLPSTAFKRYVPAGGVEEAWPIGNDGAVLPTGLEPDDWTPADQVVIRRSGPLAWRTVEALPSPLDDCDYLPSGRDDCPTDAFEVDFCGPAGPLGEPWTLDVPPLIYGINGGMAG